MHLDNLPEGALTGVVLPQRPWSKIGAGSLRRILRCVGVVNLLIFERSLAGQLATVSEQPLVRHTHSVRAVRICHSEAAVTIANTLLGWSRALDSILQS